MSTEANHYRYLAPKPRSAYKHLFVKDRWVSARTLYGMYAREEEPMTPEEIAADYDLPLEAVLEAIAYCASNPPEIQEDWMAEEALERATGTSDAEYSRTGHRRLLTPQDLARLNPS